MEPQTEKPRRLSKKQKGFVNDYVLTGNGQKAALMNYDIEAKDKENVARAIASENLTKPNIIDAIEVKQQTLKSALEKQGVTAEKIAEKVEVLLNATDEKGQTDFTAVDKGLKHATTIYGIEELDKNPTVKNTYNFIFSEETRKETKEYEKKLKAMLINNVQQN